MKVGVHAGVSQRQDLNGKINFFGPALTRAQSLCKGRSLFLALSKKTPSNFSPPLPTAAAGGQVLATMETTEELNCTSETPDTKPNIFPLGEFSFSEIGVVEEVVQVSPMRLAGRYFPPILTDANLDDVAQVLADELNRLDSFFFFF